MNDQLHEFIIAGSIGLMGWFFGGLDGFMKVLICFAVVDQVSGLCAAGIQGKISSEAGFKGIARKVMMFMLVGISHVIDKHILGDSDAFRTAICLFYIGNEGISIIENCEVLGLPIPKFLRGKFLTFAKKTLEHDIKEQLQAEERELREQVQAQIQAQENNQEHIQSQELNQNQENSSSVNQDSE